MIGLSVAEAMPHDINININIIYVRYKLLHKCHTSFINALIVFKRILIIINYYEKMVILFFLFNYWTMWCYKDDIHSQCVYMCLVMENDIDISIFTSLLIIKKKKKLNVGIIVFSKF